MVETSNLLLFTTIVLQSLAGFGRAEIGTASFYRGPYVPTACYGTSVMQIPADNNFAAVSDGVWENGAACGREYTVRCLSGAAGPPNPCFSERTIKVRVVDHAPPVSGPASPGTTLVLTVDAFNAIADPSRASHINVEFLQV